MYVSVLNERNEQWSPILVGAPMGGLLGLRMQFIGLQYFVMGRHTEMIRKKAYNNTSPQSVQQMFFFLFSLPPSLSPLPSVSVCMCGMCASSSFSLLPCFSIRHPKENELARPLSRTLWGPELRRELWWTSKGRRRA